MGGATKGFAPRWGLLGPDLREGKGWTKAEKQFIFRFESVIFLEDSHGYNSHSRRHCCER